MHALILVIALVLPPGPLQPAARFDATIERIDDATAATMTGSSWRPGCPVGLGDLRLVTLRHWGFDRRIHRGRLVVHREVALAIVDVFHRMFDARFPIGRMRLVDAYGADDDRSMRANNTSAFNCRAVTGGTSWSRHAYGLAIDINPIQNPYVYGDGSVLDPAAEPYIDRTRRAPGMIRDGDLVDRAFAAHGWRWGGRFRTIKDYQHFDRAPSTLEWRLRT